jgi:hypothetical protein|tara:strand:- start:2664 stop:3134 length:471 start_codon:yes stop_codon:yes gene_type:complete
LATPGKQYTSRNLSGRILTRGYTEKGWTYLDLRTRKSRVSERWVKADYYKTICITTAWQASQRRAKIKKLKHTITLLQVIKLYPKNHKCPVFNTPLIFGGGLNKYSPSIDRIDNLKGYTKNNVQWISARANTIKRDATLKELTTLTNYITKQQKIK